MLCRSNTARLVLLSEWVVKKKDIKCYLIFSSVMPIFASLKELKKSSPYLYFFMTDANKFHRDSQENSGSREDKSLGFQESRGHAPFHLFKRSKT